MLFAWRGVPFAESPMVRVEEARIMVSRCLLRRRSFCPSRRGTVPDRRDSHFPSLVGTVLALRIRSLFHTSELNTTKKLSALPSAFESEGMVHVFGRAIGPSTILGMNLGELEGKEGGKRTIHAQCTQS